MDPRQCAATRRVVTRRVAVGHRPWVSRATWPRPPGDGDHRCLGCRRVEAGCRFAPTARRQPPPHSSRATVLMARGWNPDHLRSRSHHHRPADPSGCHPQLGERRLASLDLARLPLGPLVSRVGSPDRSPPAQPDRPGAQQRSGTPTTSLLDLAGPTRRGSQTPSPGDHGHYQRALLSPREQNLAAGDVRPPLRGTQGTKATYCTPALAYADTVGSALRGGPWAFAQSMRLVPRGTPSTRTPPPCRLGISTANTAGGNEVPELSHTFNRLFLRSASNSSRSCSSTPAHPDGPHLPPRLPHQQLGNRKRPLLRLGLVHLRFLPDTPSRGSG